MEVSEAAPAGGSILEGTRAKLLRDPLFWTAISAFGGTGLGVFGLIWQATTGDAFYIDPTTALISQSAQVVGKALVVSSLFGVVYVLWNIFGGTTRRVVLAGMALLLAAHAVSLVSVVYWNTGNRLRGYAEFPFPALEAVAFHAVVLLTPAALFSLAAGCIVSREGRLGALLASLCLLTVPYGALRFWLFPPDPSAYVEPNPLSDTLLPLLGWYPVGVSLLQAPLWVLLGATLLRRATYLVLVGTSRTREKENLETARRLYEEGLGRGDASVVEEVVSEDFRDLKRGSRGKPAMERVFSALRKSYPDLVVSIEGQGAEDDLVRTRLVLSGTDRGGVLWYPPTGKRAAFTADFVDRFSDGKLVEHSGEADTEGLLRQLGLTESCADQTPQS